LHLLCSPQAIPVTPVSNTCRRYALEHQASLKQIFCCQLPTNWLPLALTPTGRAEENRNENPSAMTPTGRERIDDSGSHLPVILLEFSHPSRNTTRLTKASLE